MTPPLWHERPLHVSAGSSVVELSPARDDMFTLFELTRRWRKARMTRLRAAVVSAEIEECLARIAAALARGDGSSADSLRSGLDALLAQARSLNGADPLSALSVTAHLREMDEQVMAAYVAVRALADAEGEHAPLTEIQRLLASAVEMVAAEEQRAMTTYPQLAEVLSR